MLHTVRKINQRAITTVGEHASTNGIKREIELIQQVVSRPDTSLSQSLVDDLESMHITPEVKNYMMTIMAGYEPVLEAITSAHINDTKLRDDVLLSFDAIHQTLNRSKATIAQLGEAAEKAKQAHTECRLQESALVSENFTCSKGLGELDTQVQLRWGDVLSGHTAQRPVVCAPTSGPNKSDIETLRNKTWVLAQATDEYIKAEESYADKVGECAVTSGRHQMKRAECKAMQRALESAVCQHGTTAMEACSAHQSDYATKLQDYRTITANIKLRQADRLTEWSTLKRQQCVTLAMVEGKEHGDLKAGGSIAQKMSECNTKKFDNPGLIIPDKAAPPPGACPPVPKLPCTADYLTQAYGSLPKDAQAASCTSECPTSVSAPTAATAATSPTAPAPAP